MRKVHLEHFAYAKSYNINWSRWLNQRRDESSNLSTYSVLKYTYLISLPQRLSKLQYIFQMLMATTFLQYVALI